MTKRMSSLLLAVWIVGCVVTLVAILAKTETPLLRPGALVHPEARPEPELDPTRAGRLRLRWVYVDEESWQRAHTQWLSELVPVVQTRAYGEGIALLIAGVVLWSVSFWGTKGLTVFLWSRNESEGSRRLSVVVGTAAAILFAWTMTADGLVRVTRKEWLELMAGIPISFGVGFSVVCAVVWVREGFLRDRI